MPTFMPAYSVESTRAHVVTVIIDGPRKDDRRELTDLRPDTEITTDAVITEKVDGPSGDDVKTIVVKPHKVKISRFECKGKHVVFRVSGFGDDKLYSLAPGERVYVGAYSPELNSTANVWVVAEGTYTHV